MNRFTRDILLFLLKRLLIIYLVAFLLNFIWEMIQMPFFEDMSFTDLKDWLLCFRASINDAGLVIFVYILGRTFFGNWEWGEDLDILKIGYLLIIGFVIAAYFEFNALNTGRWTYSQIMPRLPLIRIGFIPVIQMCILPAVSFKIGLKIFSKYFLR
jgi:hypothetical protein